MSKPASHCVRPAAVPFLFLLLLAAGAVAHAAEPTVTSQPPLWYGAIPAKAVVDTVTMMGPGGMYPYRGDFETAVSRPDGEGFLPDGWTSADETEPVNHWHVDATRNPFHGNAAWCADVAISSCGTGDLAGGYANNWRDILEFRKTVGAVPATVRVQASLQYDCEPGYDFVTLQRRTATAPNFEAVSGGQGQSWDGKAIATVDYTFTWTAAELVGGTDIAFAFIFDSDAGWSDGDCSWPTDGAARLDDITVTVNGTAYVEDFEDGSVGPDWTKVRNTGFGDFARVWQKLGDLDDCASNNSKMVAFLDDGLVVPGTGGSVGGPSNNYAMPGGWVVNFRGGLLGRYASMSERILSPVMQLPGGQASGVTLAFDVYVHNPASGVDMNPPFYTWKIRSTAGGDITAAPWLDRNFVYYGGPAYKRSVNVVDDLLVPGATAVQVSFWIGNVGYTCDFGCIPTDGTPAPYFDNVSVKAYPQGGPRIVVTEIRLANDVFPASGSLDLANLGANSCRFDMAANISLWTHSRNDPGDSIYIDVTPRSGGTLSTPIMYWKFATKNPLFTDAHRTALASGQTEGSVTGRVTRSSTGTVVANRWNFDLPDTGMLFPGDVLQYYFAATDNVAGDSRTSTAPEDISQFGNPAPLAYPATYTVNCLPSLKDAQGTRPTVLFWNDAGSRGGEDEWIGALQQDLRLAKGVDYDVFNTHGPSSGVGNGLGGRATVAQVAGYLDMLYTCGDLGAKVLSNGDYNGDAGNDIGLLTSWLALGGRDIFLSGDDLANALYASGTAGRAFLADRMGVTYVDGDVRDNIGGQASPLVVPLAGNPVFAGDLRWVAGGGCPVINDFDNIAPAAGAASLAEYAAAGGGTGVYGAAAAILKLDGSDRVVTLDHDLSYVTDPGSKSSAPFPRRAVLLNNVLDYFGVASDPQNTSDVPGAARFAVTCYPNPFNPSVTLRYTFLAPGPVSMKVFDARGALVRTLLDGPIKATSGVATWDGHDDAGAGVAAGLYFVETRAGDQVDVRKVTMLK